MRRMHRRKIKRRKRKVERTIRRGKTTSRASCCGSPVSGGSMWIGSWSTIPVKSVMAVENQPWTDWSLSKVIGVAEKCQALPVLSCEVSRVIHHGHSH
jgi:hypothetical protein